MKSRPMLYQGVMVRAILDDIKTQTRRIFKAKNGGVWPNCNDLPGMKQIMRNCPYGQVGDRLWVRETCRAEEMPTGLDGVRYMADEAFIPIKPTLEAVDDWLTMRDYGKRASPVALAKTVPAIHMPRWASRIELEITGIRLERLQDISRGDAMAEGCPFPNLADGKNPCDWYMDLWEQINGAGSWAANPYVWVIEFKKVKP